MRSLLQSRPAAVWGLFLGILPAAAVCLVACYGDLTRVGPVSPPASRCGECHAEIYEEWRDSGHASSWTRPAYLATTSQHQMRDCLGCHAPRSIFEEGVPRLRASRRDDGVACLTCHFHNGKLTGPAPKSALVDPHPVIENHPLYRQSALCGKCHQGSYREWRTAPEKGRRTCQDCHMQHVERTATQASNLLSTVLVGFENEFKGRRHTFSLDAMDQIEDALDLSLCNEQRDPGGVRFEIKIVDRLPHAIPTGDFGYRLLRLIVEARNTDEKVITSTSQDLYRSLGQALTPGREATFPFALAGHVASIDLRVVFVKSKQTEILLCEKRWDVP